MWKDIQWDRTNCLRVGCYQNLVFAESYTKNGGKRVRIIDWSHREYSRRDNEVSHQQNCNKKANENTCKENRGRNESFSFEISQIVGRGSRSSSVPMLHHSQSRINEHSSGWKVHGLQNKESQ